MNFTEDLWLEENFTVLSTNNSSCTAGDRAEWMEIVKVSMDAFVAPVLILFGLCGNLASFVILGKIGEHVRNLVKLENQDECGTLITILLLRAFTVLDTLGMLLQPLPEACMLLYNLYHERGFKHLYYSPGHSVFPHILLWSIPVGLSVQTMLFWMACLLGVLRLSLRCCSGIPPCCIRSTRRAACFVLLVCLICLAIQAPAFQWYKVINLKRPCSGDQETMALVSHAPQDKTFPLWLARVISYSLADALPFTILFVVCCGLFIALCCKRTEEDMNRTVVHWDRRFQLITIFICVVTMLAAGLTTLVAVFDVCRSCHPAIEQLELTFQLNWWAVLAGEILLLLLQAWKVLLYLAFLKPFRQICRCKYDEVCTPDERGVFEFEYSNTKL